MIGSRRNGGANREAALAVVRARPDMRGRKSPVDQEGISGPHLPQRVRGRERGSGRGKLQRPAAAGQRGGAAARLYLLVSEDERDIPERSRVR